MLDPGLEALLPQGLREGLVVRARVRPLGELQVPESEHLELHALRETLPDGRELPRDLRVVSLNLSHNACKRRDGT